MADSKKKRIDMENVEITTHKDRYDLVTLGALWAKHLSKTEEFRHTSSADTIKFAMEQILSGTVSREEVAEACRAELESATVEQEKSNKKDSSKEKEQEKTENADKAE
jgi:hypothetical protein